ncbi:MAG: DNA polymerase III subunit beta [Clostridia bacterium]|nr:DNA polymerase III subunit beta [Clostridia bacterium]
MKILCDCDKLNEAVSVVSRAVSGRSSLSVLEGIHFRAEANGTVTLIGNDLEIGIEAKIEATVSEPGAVVLNAKMISGIVRALPEDRVSIEVNDKNLALIKSGSAKFEIAGISPEEFPELPAVDSEYSVAIPAAMLKDMISKTIFAVAVTDNNPILTGCLLEISKQGLTMVALDGYRMAIRRAAMENDFEEKKMIIPEKSLSELARILGDEEEDVRILATARHAIFLFRNYRMVTRLIEGNYFNYQAAIPKDYEMEIACSARQLTNSIQRASLIILNDLVKSPVKFRVEDGNINISCTTPAGSVDDNIPVDIKDKALEIGFYNRYLLEAFRVIDTEDVRLQFKAPTTPLVILPPEGDAYLYLILPLRLKAD